MFLSTVLQFVYVGFVMIPLVSWTEWVSLLVPDSLSAAAADIFCLCPCSPMHMGMGGLFQAWDPSTDLPMNGASMDKFPQMNGLCRNTDF